METRGDTRLVDCPYCGSFSISGTAIAILPSLTGPHDPKAGLLAHALRQMQKTQSRPVLTSDAARTIMNIGQFPTVDEQADNVVRWLGDNSPGTGKDVTISPETHGAIFGTGSDEGFLLVLNGLKDSRLINWYSTFGPELSLHLTFQGMRRYERLRAAVSVVTPSAAAPRVATSTSRQISHRHAAILFTDIVGYTNLLGFDEAGALAARSACVSAGKGAGERNNGRLVKTLGDGTLSEFSSTIDAVRTALEINSAVAPQNSARPEHKHISLRMGLAVGDIVVEESDVHGTTVNLAQRLQAEATPGTICTTEHIRDDITNKIDVASGDLGLRQLKGIERLVRVIQITPR